MRTPRIALVHDWLTGMRGGEKCLEVFCRLWPHADLFTLLATKGDLAPAIRALPLRTSFLNRLPGIGRYYRHLLPLMPRAAESFRLTGYDLVFSSSHCVAKGVQAPAGVPHVCYCHTPMRYAWHMREVYLENMRPALRPVARVLLRYLRAWDRRTAKRVTHFIANSQTVRRRIGEAYGRDSVVIPPPVDTSFFTPAKDRRESYYLVVSALVPYKRVDLAVAACTRLGRPLVVIGTGQDERRLRALAGTAVTFAGWQPNAVIRDHLRRCRALLFPGEEDFGIVPVEANACGTPVIAYGRGGATETIVPPAQRAAPTGVWFADQTPDNLADAMRHLEKHAADFTPEACRRQALRFSRERFEQAIRSYVDGVLRVDAAPEWRRAA
jgi:glycosyltransferase involved in cell wall biosynthesis